MQKSWKKDAGLAGFEMQENDVCHILNARQRHGTRATCALQYHTFFPSADSICWDLFGLFQRTFSTSLDLFLLPVHGIKLDDNPHLTTPTQHVMVGITRSKVIWHISKSATMGVGLGATPTAHLSERAWKTKHYKVLRVFAMSNPLWQILRCCWCLLETPIFSWRNYRTPVFFLEFCMLRSFQRSNRSMVEHLPSPWSGREFRWRPCLGETAIRKAEKIRRAVTRFDPFWDCLKVETFFEDMDFI